MRVTLLLGVFVVGCSTSDVEPADDSEADVECSISDRTIRCDRRFDPMVDAADAYEHTALHLVLAEPLDEPLTFEGTMDLVHVLFHQVWPLDSTDELIDGFDPPGIFVEAQLLHAGIESGLSSRIEVSGELVPEGDGCVSVDLAVLSGRAFAHDWSATACPR